MSKRRDIGSDRGGERRRGEGAFAQGLDELSAWFERKKRVLPWRDDPSLYRVWISEIMLQQTQVITVVPYFERFVARFPTVEALASASEADVMAHWAGLGYYSRARNLLKGAQLIVASGFPRHREGWLEIPGVGGYTAGAILSIALDQPEAILDGNVERVLSRLRRVSRSGRSEAFARGGDAAYKARLWRLSWAVVRRAHARGLRPRVINQALMELGATVCKPREPLCGVCPLAGLCRARAAGEQEQYPPRKARKQWVEVREEMDCVLSGDRVLMRQRAAGEWRAGLWDLPEASSAKSPEASSAKSSEASERGEAAERVAGAAGGEGRAMLLGALEWVGEVETRHVVTRHKITRVTRVWRVEAQKKSPSTGGKFLRAAESGGTQSSAVAGLRWVSMASPEVAVGSAAVKTLQAVRERYGD